MPTSSLFTSISNVHLGEPKYGLSGRRTLVYLLFKRRLSATEAGVVRSFMPFLLYGLVDREMVVAWQIIAAYSAEYKRRVWKGEVRQHWLRLLQKLGEVIEFHFNKPTVDNSPKFHNLMHDLLNLELFGSYRNIDEMNHEKAHQRSKQQAHLDNSRIAMEKSLLQRV